MAILDGLAPTSVCRQLSSFGLTAGGMGCFGLALVWILRRAPAVPIADPQLAESLGYEQ